MGDAIRCDALAHNDEIVHVVIVVVTFVILIVGGSQLDRRRGRIRRCRRNRNVGSGSGWSCRRSGRTQHEQWRQWRQQLELEQRRRRRIVVLFGRREWGRVVAKRRSSAQRNAPFSILNSQFGRGRLPRPPSRIEN
jgi:hypothetical protein